MGSLMLLFVITLSVIMLASYREIRQNNSDMLERFAELYSLEQLPGEQDAAEAASKKENRPESDSDSKQGERSGSEPKPGGPDPSDPGAKKGKPPLDDRPDYQLSTFYSVALADDGTVLAVDNGEKAVYSEEDLVRIAKELLAENRESGRTGSLTYIISRRDGYTLAAFMDNTVTETGMKTLVRYILIVGGAAIAALFFISLFLSKRIIRPLEENDRKQKQFISDAGHELKTPVAVIGVNADLLSGELGENEWLANIKYENDRMGELLKQLLDLSRAESAEAPDSKEQVDFSRVVTGEVLAFESLAFDRGKSIQSDIPEGISIPGSQTLLTQMVSVLLDNAIRHSTGSEIDVSLQTKGHTAVFRVTNEGEEISPEKQEHLFDRFYRLDEARSGEGQHYGLGLSIAKAAAEKHGGNIAVSCRDGKVCFTVSLPVKKQVS